jgi:hypothetical protein
MRRHLDPRSAQLPPDGPEHLPPEKRRPTDCSWCGAMMVSVTGFGRICQTCDVAPNGPLAPIIVPPGFTGTPTQS